MADLLVAVDQGSSATKALLVDSAGAVLARAAVPIGTSHPKPGWVEQSPAEIWGSVRAVLASVLADVHPVRLAGLALSTQRESMTLWDAKTGEAVAPLISWQDQRTVGACEDLTRSGHATRVREVTGLPLDPMFSGTRAQWLLRDHGGGRSGDADGRLRLGTVDSWLIHRLTGRHLTEPGSASRTQLLALHDVAWDPEMLDLFGVPRSALPTVVPSSGPFAQVRGCAPLLDGTPVLAVLADSHAALFAHGAWTPGALKATYGTGSSVMGVTGVEGVAPASLTTTVAWDHDGPVLAVEGNIRSSGSTLVWLARALGRTPAELAALAETVDSSEGVVLVPGFSGLGAPYWDRATSGLLTGLTLGSEPAHLARAALDSVVLQTDAVVQAAAEQIGPVRAVLADGGPSSNPFLMQLQADVSGCDVLASQEQDLSALGAVHLAGLAAGLWGLDDLAEQRRPRRRYRSTWSEDRRASTREGWNSAVARSRAAS